MYTAHCLTSMSDSCTGAVFDADGPQVAAQDRSIGYDSGNIGVMHGIWLCISCIACD